MEIGIHHVAALDAESLAGYHIFVLPGDRIVDQETFFEAVRATLPLDPPLMSNRVWDAMSDSLWEGLYQHPAKHIAIVWPNARLLKRADPSAFEAAISVLSDVVHLLGDARATQDKTKHIAVVVESDREPGSRTVRRLRGADRSPCRR